MQKSGISAEEWFNALRRRSARLVLVLMALLAGAVWTTSSFAAGAWQDLGLLRGGESSIANGVSADGSVVVGEAIDRAGKYHAFYWTKAKGMVDLGNGILVGANAYAYAVSADGSVVVGGAEDGSGNTHAFRWSEASGMVDLGALPSAQIGNNYAFAVSADGSVVAGEATDSSGTVVHAFRWTAADGMVDLGTLAGSAVNPLSQGWGISADGSVVVGSGRVSDAPIDHAFRWTEGGGIVDIHDTGLSGAQQSSFAYGASSDGTVLVGSAFVASAGAMHAYRWTEATGMADLGILKTGDDSAALAVSGDGSVVIGYSEDENEHEKAFRWTQATKMQTVGQWLAAHGVAASRVPFGSARAISPDGNVLVGTLSNNNHAFLAQVYPILSVSIQGTGKGVVTAAGLSCAKGTCTHAYVTESLVTLTATVSQGAKFDGWSGACQSAGTQGSCVLTMSADTSVGASFTAVPLISVSPPSVYLKTATIGRKVSQRLTVANKGLAPLTVNNIAIDGANADEFSETNSCSGPLNPAKSCSITVVYSAPDSAIAQAVMHISSDDPVTPLLDVSLTANGPHIVATPVSRNFGFVSPGKSKSAKFTITNKGNQPLTISGISIDGADETEFTETDSCSGPLDPGGSCALKVFFTPKSTAVKSARVTVASNDPATQDLYIPLSGGRIVVPNLTGDTAVQASIVSGYQTLQGGLSYPLLQVEVTLPAGSPLKPALRAGLQKMLGSRPAPLASASSPAATLTYNATLGLYDSGFTIRDNIITDTLYTDAAGTTPAGTLTVTYPEGTTITSLGDTSATPPYTMTISADITAGNLPIIGGGTIQLNDTSGAGEINGTFTLTATHVTVGADLSLSDAGNVSGSAIISENGQTVSVTDITGPFSGTLTGKVTVEPQGYTGTADVSIMNGTFNVNLVTPTGTATGSFGTDGLTITFQDGSKETIIDPLTLQPTTPPINGTISGTVYSDSNKNRKLDNGEPGVPGVTVTLTGPNGTTNATTSSTGAYSFNNLTAGVYTLSSPPAASGESLETTSPLSVTLVSGQNATGENFGYIINTTVKYKTPQSLDKGWGRLYINNSGLIVTGGGKYYTSPTAKAASLPPYQSNPGSASALNNNGEILGSQGNYPLDWGNYTSIPTVIVVQVSWPAALNDNGHLVGGGSYWASASAQPTSLNWPDGTTPSALSVNNNDLIVGSLYTTESGQYQLAYWSGASAQPLVLPGSAVSQAYSTAQVNAKGQLFASWGGVEFSSFPVTLFWSSVTAQPVTLPLLPNAIVPQAYFGVNVGGMAMNGSGLVVGSSTDSSGAYRAAIWDNGQIEDLNDLIPSGSGWVLQGASWVNDNGEIVGIGTYGGYETMYYLAPK